MKQAPQQNQSYTFVIITAIILAGVVAFNLYLSSLRPIKDIRHFKPHLVSQIVSSDGQIIKTFGAFNYEQVPLTSIPPHLTNAIIATEDKNFYSHRGFDLIALFRSVLINVVEGRFAQGASTITQQLARILFLSNEKTLDRKLKELIIAHRIEKSLTKDEILTMYLNNVYLGEGSYGVSAAASAYFNKDLEDLTLAQCALIAGLPQAPSAYSPYRSKELAYKRRAKVLSRMKSMRFISQTQYEQALNEEIVLRENRVLKTVNKAPYFTDYVMKELEEIGFSQSDIERSGVKVITTIDYELQKSALETIKKQLALRGLTKPYQQAALFSYDTVTGKILAYVGGKDYTNSQFDRISLAIRQPGSAFKMFVYTAAMKQGLDVNDEFDDVPLKIREWAPRNYGNKYRIKLPLYKALAYSSNVVAVRVLEKVGISETVRTARRLGITTPIEDDYTIALGSSGVKLFEITRAYGCLANGGYLVAPYSVERIESSSGKILYQAKPSHKKVLDIYTVAKVTAMLKEVVSAGTGRGAQIGRVAAGKTGTTDSYRDAWFIGYTPEIATGVWVGNDNNTPTRRLTGGSIPARIWKGYMTKATENLVESTFNYPEVELTPYTYVKPQEFKSGNDLLEDIDKEIEEINKRNIFDKLFGKSEGELELEIQKPDENIDSIDESEETNQPEELMPAPSTPPIVNYQIEPPKKNLFKPKPPIPVFED